MDNQFDSFEKHLMDKASLNHLAISGTFELLPYCNMSCNMCYIQQYPTLEKLNALKKPDFWINIIKQGMDEGLLFVLFTGGEFFLYPWYKELYEDVHKLPVYIIINTNATLLDEEKVKWLAQYPPKRINISLYGTNNETYDKLCHNPQGFTQVIKAFDLLKQYHIPYRVHTTLVKENANQYDEFVHICNQYQVPLQMVSYMYPSYRKNKAIGYNEDRLDPKLAAFYQFKYTKDQYRDDNAFNEYVDQMLYAIDHFENSPFYKYQKMSCRGGNSSFWINWKGEVSSCGMMANDQFDLTKMSFKQAWKKVKESHDRVMTSKACSLCSKRHICIVCVASMYCETGKNDGTPQYVCELTYEYERLLRKYKDERNNIL